MTDKELLTLAAKAAGIDGVWQEGYGLCLFEEYLFNPGNEPRFWNPLTDDGDALRLAVKLGLIPGYLRFMQTSDDTDIVFVRRAIVRAAAEIGKAMK